MPVFVSPGTRFGGDWKGFLQSGGFAKNKVKDGLTVRLIDNLLISQVSNPNGNRIDEQNSSSGTRSSPLHGC